VDLERRAMSRLRALVVTFALGALLAGVLSVFAFNESQRAAREARNATARELAAASVANLDVDPERSILLALEAVDVTRQVDGTVLPEAEEALHRAVRTSRLVHTFAHGGFGLAVTSDGSRIATGGSDPADSTVAIWNLHTGQRELVIPDQGPGRALLAYSPDDRLLATAPNDGTVRLWDGATGDLLQVLSRADRIAQMPPAFSPDGRWVAAPGWQQPTVVIWDVATGSEVMTLTADDEPAVIAFSPDGAWLAGGYGDGTLWIWDLATSAPAHVLSGHESEVNQIAFNPDGSQVATVSSDATIRIWDTQPWQHRATFFADASVGSVAYSPDGTRLATGASDGTVIVWDVETGRRQLLLAGHTTWVPAVAFIPKTDLLVTSSVDNTTRLWDIGVAGARDWLTVPGSWPYPVAFSADGTSFAVHAGDGRVTIHDLLTGDARVVPGGDEVGIAALAFSPDGRTLARAGWAEAGAALSLWDVNAASLLPLVGHLGGGVSDVAYSSDGQRLVSLGWNDGMVGLWDPVSASLVRLIPIDSQWVHRVAISPDGGLVAALGSTEGEIFTYDLHVFNADTGEHIATLTQVHELEAWGLAFLPDGRLITASQDGTAKVWDLDTMERMWTFHHDTQVNDVAVSPDGTRIATALDDGTARIWDLASGRQLMTLYGHDLPVWRVTFSPDGRLLATASDDGTVALHLLPIDEFLELARTRVTRSLTDDECRQFLHLASCP
jgi:WD40 repeat protein